MLKLNVNLIEKAMIDMRMDWRMLCQEAGINERSLRKYRKEGVDSMSVRSLRELVGKLSKILNIKEDQVLIDNDA